LLRRFKSPNGMPLADISAATFNHPVGAAEQHGRHVEAEVSE
jgi:hypothetical protein